MYRTSTVLLAAAALLLAGAGPGGRSPAARFLQVKGKATVLEADSFDRPAALYGTIYANERLVVDNGAQVTLVFRGDGHVERITAPGKFTVTPKGCQPQAGVQRVEMAEQARATIGKISSGPRGIVQGGVVVARAAAPPSTDKPAPQQGDELPAIADSRTASPLEDSTVLASKPTFTWPAVPKAKQYIVTLGLDVDVVWSAKTEKTQLEYAGQPALKPGEMYWWQVAAIVGGRSVPVFQTAAFHAASDRQREEAAALEKLLVDREPLGLAAAAMWYKQNGLIAEAIAANQQLAKLAPQAAIYRELSELYYRAGREKDGNAAETKADELEKAEGATVKAEVQ
jgi:hypothetical protein